MNQIRSCLLDYGDYKDETSGIQIPASRLWFYMVSNTIIYQHIYERMLITLDEIEW